MHMLLSVQANVYGVFVFYWRPGLYDLHGLESRFSHQFARLHLP